MKKFYPKNNLNLNAIFTSLFLIACLSLPTAKATAQNNVQLVPLTFNNTQNLLLPPSRTHDQGPYILPQPFSITAEIRVDASSSQSNDWEHIIEVGGREFGYNCPFRLEIGREGIWYVAVGDGQTSVGEEFQGNWNYNVWTRILITYANGTLKFYENDQLIHQFVANKNVNAVQGSLIVGSYQGQDRFFNGELRNGNIVSGVSGSPSGTATFNLPPYLQLPNFEFNGQFSETMGVYQFPQAFSLETEVRIDASNQWRHLIEVGGKEFGWNAPLRLETGNEGQWYLAVGDGASYVEAEFPGFWNYGDWTKILITYFNGTIRFYEQGQLIQQFVANKNMGAVQGSLILGSYQGQDRFFQGGLRNARIVTQDLTPPGAATSGMWQKLTDISALQTGDQIALKALHYSNNGHTTPINQFLTLHKGNTEASEHVRAMKQAPDASATFEIEIIPSGPTESFVHAFRESFDPNPHYIKLILKASNGYYLRKSGSTPQNMIATGEKQSPNNWLPEVFFLTRAQPAGLFKFFGILRSYDDHINFRLEGPNYSTNLFKINMHAAYSNMQQGNLINLQAEGGGSPEIGHFEIFYKR